jgi:hypothetical protein
MMVVLCGLCLRSVIALYETGRLGECGECRTGRVRVIRFHIRSSKGGSRRMCRLRTDRLAPVNKIDYVLAHT